MLRGNSEESTCQLQRFFSTIRGFYVLIINQWYLISNNHEKSRIQVRIIQGNKFEFFLPFLFDFTNVP